MKIQEWQKENLDKFSFWCHYSIQRQIKIIIFMLKLHNRLLKCALITEVS